MAILEEWKEINGSDGFQVSSFGRFKNKNDEIVEPRQDGQGYLRICVGNSIRKRVHQFVAEAFIPNPFNKEQINHKNNNKLDNRAVNLEWVTVRENSLMAGRDGLIRSKGKKPPRRIVAIKTDLSQRIEFITQNEAAQILGISSKDINKCLNGHRKTSHGYYWKFIDENDRYNIENAKED